jgi:hypothetical protein
MPSEERIQHAAEILAKFGEVEAMWGWFATFRRDTLECTGVWPPRTDQDWDDIEVPVLEFMLDCVDPVGSWERHKRRSQLAVRQGIERHDLNLELMREELGEDDD